MTRLRPASRLPARLVQHFVLPMPARPPVRLACMLLVLICLVVLLPAGCNSEDATINLPRFSKQSATPASLPLYRFAIHPLHNPKRLFALYQPLVNAINRKAEEFQIKLVASRDYAAFERRLYAGDFDIALPNPLQTLESLKHGYRVVGKMGDDHHFRGLIIARRDANIMFVEDLAGKPLSFPAPTALAATMMPKAYLKIRGLDLSTTPIHYVGSQESAIMNAYFGKTVAAGTWPLPWEQMLRERPEIGEVLKVVWETDPLVNNGLVVKNAMPAEHATLIMDVLLGLPDTAEGRSVLAGIHLSCFEASGDEAYAVVRSFIERYDELFPDLDEQELP